MLKFLKRNTEKSPGLFSRLKKGLTKTRQNFGAGIGTLLLGKKILDETVIEEIETYLLTADVGTYITDQVVSSLTTRLKRKELTNSEAALVALKNQLTELLQPAEKDFEIDETKKPFVILTVGVNGSGKTTTIGKLTSALKTTKQNIMLAAGDTFRAAAIEQLQVWGDRNDVPVIAQKTGSDSASVIFDAMQSAQSKQADILIADTAGRLHTQSHLMDELKKVVRVIKKRDEAAPHEILLVLDATLGQNALQQAKQFHEAVGVTGIALTKLDGTAKGGIIFSIAAELKLPIYFIGIGEQIDDLRPFEARAFVDALFETE